jgi:gamma-glutamyltranspeptidase/glutathione hydrolase
VFLVSHIFDKGFSPQQAINYPRVRVTPTDNIVWEKDLNVDIQDYLINAGHPLDRDLSESISEFGGAQLILCNPQLGFYQAGSDHRKDGCALGIKI